MKSVCVCVCVSVYVYVCECVRMCVCVCVLCVGSWGISDGDAALINVLTERKARTQELGQLTHTNLKTYTLRHAPPPSLSLSLSLSHTHT